MKIVTLNELEPEWKWFRDEFAAEADLTWSRNHTLQGQRIPTWLPRRHTVARMLAAWNAAGDLENGRDLLITHGPRPTLYGALSAKLRRGGTRHLAFLNFTDLPVGLMRRVMAAAFKHVDHFAVYSTMEQRLYSDYFRLPIERFEMVHWGVHRPSFDAQDPAIEAGDYICALGSQARDYAVLCDAMRQLPRIRLVIVATARSMLGIEPPANVTVRQDISLPQAMNILGHSRFMVLPLRANDVPCGHVTLVSAMHLGKAVICTDSSGVTDYVQPGITGRIVQPGDANALARAIESLSRDPSEVERLGAAGKSFATEHCSELTTIDHLKNYLSAIRMS